MTSLSTRFAAAIAERERLAEEGKKLRAELYCDTDLMTAEQIEFAKRMQDERLRSMAKRMPHRYWANIKERAHGR